MKKVVVVQRVLTQYRVEFFDRLKAELESREINLELIIGDYHAFEKSKSDQASLRWATSIDNISLKVLGSRLIWQPCLKYLRNADLVIVEQANVNLVNYWLMLLRPFKKRRLAFWGHGENLQIGTQSWKNRFKRKYINYCDWWFAYTKKVHDYLSSHGFPSEKITIVQNAIDSKQLREEYVQINLEECESLKKNLRLNDTNNIGIYCGALYKEKRIEFLLEASLRVKKSIKDFHLIILGGGKEQCIVERAANQYEWIHYVGPVFGNSKLKYFKISSVLLMPGAIGLIALDSFITETPIITTKNNIHGPEYEYLIHEWNAIIAENQLEEFSNEIIRLLQNKDYLKTITRNALECAGKYTLEQMVGNFTEGIVDCLDVGK